LPGSPALWWARSFNLHPLSLGLIGRRDIIDFRKATIVLVKVNPIAYDKDVIDLSS
jgi:hypothetical protein